MWLEFAVTVIILLLVITVSGKVAKQYDKPSLDWGFLCLAGVALTVSGAFWVIRGWEPTGGPYEVGQVYPFGSYVQAWIVSFGFSWIALGIMFFLFSLIIAQKPVFISWLTLVTVWIIILLPHGIIGAAMTFAGKVSATQVVDDNSVLTILINIAEGVTMLTFVVSSITGFIWTGLNLRRNNRATEKLSVST